MNAIPPRKNFRRKADRPAGKKRISEDAIARITAKYNWRSSSSLGPRPTNPFALTSPPPLHPPGVGPDDAGGRMAFDDSISATCGWGASAFGAVGQEGQTFIGYPLLAELAQRPEYRVVSETIATEMTRKWIKLMSKSGQDLGPKLDAINDKFLKLDVQGNCSRLIEQDGLFGRSHLYIDTGDGLDTEELQTSIGDGRDVISRLKVGIGSIKRLSTVEAVWCYPTSYNSSDPLRDDWYNPQMWYAMKTAIHTTRLVCFVGREVPDLLKPVYSFGGLSLSQIIMPYVQNWLITRQSVNNILRAFTTFVLSTNISASIQADGAEMIQRALLFNATRDNGGLMMIDKEAESFENVSAPLGTLDHLQAQAQEHMAAPARIPLVKLLGISPSGLNASSEGEIRVFYDTIHAEQEKKLRPIIHSLLGFVQLDLFGEIDDDIIFDFEPLWEMDEKQLAEVEKIKAETGQILVDSGTVHPEENRAKIANDPNSGYDNIDVNDVPDLEQEEQAGLEPLSPGKSGGGGVGDEADATDTLYVRRPLRNGAKLREWAKSQGFETTLEPGDMHVTIAYSKTPVDWNSVTPKETGMRAAGGRRSIEQFDKGAIVLRFESAELKSRWDLFRRLGASWKYEEYSPHVTISYDPGEDFDFEAVEPYMGPLDFDGEIFEPIKRDFDPADVRVAKDKQWEESKHPRGQPGNAGQFGSGGGGSKSKTKKKAAEKPAAEKPAEVTPEPATPGKAEKPTESREETARPTPEPATPSSTEKAAEKPDIRGRGTSFVSPEVEFHQDMTLAQGAVKSSRQKALLKASAEIDRALGIKHREDRSAVGSWEGAVEASVMTIAKEATMAELKTAAAMKGYLANQKAVLVFRENPEGSSYLCHFDAEGTLAEIGENLHKAGINGYTLVPEKKGAKVYVADIDGKVATSIMQGVAKHGFKNVECRLGDAEFVGTDKEDGTDDEQRAHARETYLRTIKESGVQGAGAVWDRVHSTYGESVEKPLAAAGAKLTDKIKATAKDFALIAAPMAAAAVLEKAPELFGEHVAGLVHHALDTKFVENWSDKVIMAGLGAIGFEEGNLTGLVVAEVAAYAVSRLLEKTGWNELTVRKVVGGIIPTIKKVLNSPDIHRGRQDTIDRFIEKHGALPTELTHDAAQADEWKAYCAAATRGLDALLEQINKSSFDELMIDPEQIRAIDRELSADAGEEPTEEPVSEDAWNEGDHPRGQPGNAGQFGSGGGGSATEGGGPPAPKPAGREGRAGAEQGRTSRRSPSSGPYRPGIAEGDPAAVKSEWRKGGPDTLEALLAASPKNQDALAVVAQEVAAKSNAHLRNPGVKSPDRIKEKIDRGKTPQQVNDAVRLGFDVKAPADADAIIKQLGEKFEVADEGWTQTDAGYFDRKAIVRFPDGQLGEVQLWAPGMIDAKEVKGGHQLYEQMQKLPPGDAGAEQLRHKMQELYRGVMHALPAEWASLFPDR